MFVHLEDPKEQPLYLNREFLNPSPSPDPEPTDPDRPWLDGIKVELEKVQNGVVDHIKDKLIELKDDAINGLIKVINDNFDTVIVPYMGVLITFVAEQIIDGVKKFVVKYWVNNSGTQQVKQVAAGDYYQVIPNFYDIINIMEEDANSIEILMKMSFLDNFGRVVTSTESPSLEDAEYFSYRNFNCALIENDYPTPIPDLDKVYVKSLNLTKSSINQIYKEPISYNIGLNNRELSYNSNIDNIAIQPRNALIRFIPSRTFSGSQYFAVVFYVNRTEYALIEPVLRGDYYLLIEDYTSITGDVQVDDNDLSIDLNFLDSTNRIITRSVVNAKIGLGPKYLIDFDKRYYTTEITEQDIVPQTLNLQNKTVELTQNVTDYIVEPDVGYQGLGTVEIDTNISGSSPPNLQTKSVTVTQNGNQTISPDSGYQGLQSVELTTNVPTPQPNLQSKTIELGSSYSYSPLGPTTETIVPDSGYDGFSSVTYAIEPLLCEQTKTQTITQNGTFSITPSQGYDIMKSASITVNVNSNAPKIGYIGFRSTLNTGDNIKLTDYNFTIGSSTNQNIPDGRTAVVLKYEDNNTILNMFVLGNKAGGINDFQFSPGNNSYYTIFNFEIGDYVYIFDINGVLINTVTVGLVNTNYQDYYRGGARYNYTNIDYPLPGELHTS